MGTILIGKRVPDFIKTIIHTRVKKSGVSDETGELVVTVRSLHRIKPLSKLGDPTGEIEPVVDRH